MNDTNLEVINTLYQNAHNFWSAWQKKETDFAKLDSTIKLIEEVNQLLNQFCEGVIFECWGNYEDFTNKTATLVFSANGSIDYFPQIQVLTTLAKEYTTYSVHAFRPQMNSDHLAIRMNDDLTLTTSEILVSLSTNNDYPALTIGFTKPIPDDLFDNTCNAAMVLIDHVLGEWRSIIQIETINFSQDELQDAIPLTQLSDALEELWQNLGYTGIYPEDEWQYNAYQSNSDEQNDEGPTITVLRNESAHSLIGNDHINWFICITCSLSEGGIDSAFALQDDFEAEANTYNESIETVVVTDFLQGCRSIYYMTNNPSMLIKKAQQICANYTNLETEIECGYDPYWKHYRL